MSPYYGEDCFKLTDIVPGGIRGLNIIYELSVTPTDPTRYNTAIQMFSLVEFQLSHNSSCLPFLQLGFVSKIGCMVHYLPVSYIRCLPLGIIHSIEVVFAMIQFINCTNKLKKKKIPLVLKPIIVGFNH